MYRDDVGSTGRIPRQAHREAMQRRLRLNGWQALVGG
jgi:hypothetical protein